MLTKYESLSTKSKKVVDRLGWDHEGGREVRDRLTSNVVKLTQFYQGLISSSVYRLEDAMGRLLREFQRGSRDVDSVSIITSDREGGTKDGAWALIIRDLEDLGITPEVANQHRAFVVQWFTKAINEGQLAGLLPDKDSARVPSFLPTEDTQSDNGRSVDVREPQSQLSAEATRDAVAHEKRRQAVKATIAELASVEAQRIDCEEVLQYDEDGRELTGRMVELRNRINRLAGKDWATCDLCDLPMVYEHHCCLSLRERGH